MSKIITKYSHTLHEPVAENEPAKVSLNIILVKCFIPNFSNVRLKMIHLNVFYVRRVLYIAKVHYLFWFHIYWVILVIYFQGSIFFFIFMFELKEDWQLNGQIQEKK